MTRVLLTGASGFIGTAVQALLLNDPRYTVHSAYRQVPEVSSARLKIFQVSGLEPNTDWLVALDGVGVVVHCAARVHVMDELEADPLEAFRRVNVQGTLRLAEQAAQAGVRRFIFLSSIKVNGESTVPGGSFTSDDVPAPLDPYGISKLEAEQALRALSARTGMEVVIIRPVLVYGPGVKANFRSMMAWLSRGVPLPFGTIYNKRSLVALDNLVDLIGTCIDHPSAANQVFLVSDDQDLSTSELLRLMARALGRPARLLPLPVWLMSSAAQLLGKKAISQRLCGSLQVDIKKTKALLDWKPVISVSGALEKTAKYFLEH